MAHRGRIARKFSELRRRNEAALIPFIVAGDPDMASTHKLVLELESRGADLIELGVPFSDPMADGPANQHAIARGLSSGASLAGILSVDLPPEENAELQKPARANGIDLIYLLAPTTPLERSRRIARSAGGFLYYVSVTGVTGARGAVGGDVEGKVRELRSVSDLPIGV